jgi:hypothetical protein
MSDTSGDRSRAAFLLYLCLPVTNPHEIKKVVRRVYVRGMNTRHTLRLPRIPERLFTHSFFLIRRLNGFKRMSRVVGAQVHGNLQEEYEAIIERKEDDVPDSEVLRSIIRDGIDSQEYPYRLLDLANETAAHVERDREPGESKYAPLKRAVQDGIESRRGDTLDGIGAGAELRDMVESEQNDGEDLDETLRRLVRDGVESNSDQTLRERVALGVTVFALMIVPTLVAFMYGFFASLLYAIIVAGVVLLEPQLNTAWSRIREILSPLLSRAASVPRILTRE